MADDANDPLWLAARAQAAQLSDADLWRQIEANRVLAGALRAEARARNEAERLQAAGDDRARLAAIKAQFDAMPTS